MDALTSQLINDKIWGFKTIFMRNLLARCAVFYNFMLEGILVGVLSCYLASIQDNLNLTDSELGTAMLFSSLGTVVVAPFTAFCLRHLGSKWTTYLGAMCFGLSYCLIPMAKSFGVLIVMTLIYGGGLGVMDISMNACAILTEIIANKPLLGSFHGSYSVAAALGSVIGGALVGTDFTILTVFVAFSVVSVLTTSFFASLYYDFKQEVIITEFNLKNQAQHNPDSTQYSPLIGNPAAGDCESADPSHKVNIFSAVQTQTQPTEQPKNLSSTNASSDNQVYTPLLAEPSFRSEEQNAAEISKNRWIIAFYSMVGFLASFGESSIVTWSIVYFDRTIHTSSVLKSMGFTSFMIAMALGRFTSDHLRKVFGRQIIVRVGGLLALGGMILVVMSLDLPCNIAFACIGFAITGMGLSTLIPIAFSSAGHTAGVHAGTSIATVAMFTYCGGIISSPLVGVLSDSFGSLRYALLFDGILLGLIFPLSWGIPPESHNFISLETDRAADEDDPSCCQTVFPDPPHQE